MSQNRFCASYVTHVDWCSSLDCVLDASAFACGARFHARVSGQVLSSLLASNMELVLHGAFSCWAEFVEATLSMRFNIVCREAVLGQHIERRRTSDCLHGT